MIENPNEILLIITNIIPDYIKGLYQLPTCQLSINKNNNNDYYVFIMFINTFRSDCRETLKDCSELCLNLILLTKG